MRERQRETETVSLDFRYQERQIKGERSEGARARDLAAEEVIVPHAQERQHHREVLRQWRLPTAVD